MFERGDDERAVEIFVAAALGRRDAGNLSADRTFPTGDSAGLPGAVFSYG